MFWVSLVSVWTVHSVMISQVYSTLDLVQIIMTSSSDLWFIFFLAILHRCRIAKKKINQRSEEDVIIIWTTLDRRKMPLEFFFIKPLFTVWCLICVYPCLYNFPFFFTFNYFKQYLQYNTMYKFMYKSVCPGLSLVLFFF